jgi:SAM-dependent methyltransferase
MKHEASPNHDYVLSRAAGTGAGASPRILDFGCGTGTLIRKGRERGLNIVGADAYPRHWQGSDDPVVAAHVFRIADGRLPFPDGHFDVVTSNMVFEHVAPGELPAAFREIARVLIPGGRALLLFPTRDVWFEGHAGLYFVHRLKGVPRLRRAYLHAAHRLGFGYLRGDLTAAQWVSMYETSLDTDIFHHTFSTVRTELLKAFGTAPTSLTEDYMRFRMAGLTDRSPALFRLTSARLAAPLLTWLGHKRAARVLGVIRAAGSS